ncbi:DUF669 domain-containing protein [Enterococcus gallinarum]|uniref:DUF669 domain-containing protein n=1 Tax=Enterococcus gallinarum TaxID=1353 RepID=UPI001BD889EC|nr:DUF669 domain-containing protein [Enterococcus gallinarum]
MALFVVDSQNILGKSVREAGSYNVTILHDSECKKTKETQNDMAVFNYEVIDGKYKGGKILYDNIVWDNNDVELSVKRFNTILAAVGIPDGTRIESIQQLVNGLKGKSLNITVDWKHSEYNDRWNLTVKGYNKFDSEGSKPNGAERPSGNLMNQRRQNDLSQAANKITQGHEVQGSLPGIDPLADTRSFANGGFDGAAITDDDLPF